MIRHHYIGKHDYNYTQEKNRLHKIISDTYPAQHIVSHLNEMYALPNKTQHKLIVKVRGGISQKLDNSVSTTASSSPFKSVPISFKESALSKHIDEIGFNAELSHLPQPIFHSVVEKNGNKSRSSLHFQRAHKKNITPEHNEMIKFVQTNWKGVERDYKKSVNNYISNIDLNNSSDNSHSSAHLKSKHAVGMKKKTATTSSPLLLSGSYHHTSVAKDSSGAGRQDSFQPFDLEAFWGNRILKRLTEES